MSKTQSFPIANEAKTEVIQRNFQDLFEYAHEHSFRITIPSASEGTVGDLVLVYINNTCYLYAKLPVGWKKVTLS